MNRGQTRTSITGSGQSAVIDTSDAKFVGVQLTGSFTATITFQTSIDGTTWVDTGVTPAAGGAVVTSATAPGLWLGTVNAATNFRATATAFTGGPVIVHLVKAD